MFGPERRQIKLLGKGNFASVYLQLNGKMCYACKKIRLPSAYSISFIINEINSLKCLDHPNLVKYYGSSFNSFKTYDILLEYIQGQALDEAYKSYKNEEILMYWIYQLCKGLQYLKSKGIVHRDLKPQNILVNSKGIIKIVDFGISKIMTTQQSEIMGTLYYIAPQIIKQKYICFESDIWSLGIMFYQLSHQKMPFKIEDKKEPTKQKMLKSMSQIQIENTRCSPQFEILLKGMLKVNPHERMTAHQILNHKVIKSRQSVFENLYQIGNGQRQK